MLEVPMIQSRGFKNTAHGFEMRLRLPYYRGLWTGHLKGAKVSVDGETWEPSQMRWTIGALSGSLDELRNNGEGRWPVDVPAVLAFERSEPLSAGMHDVSVVLMVDTSYIPVELMPLSWTEEREMVITK